MRFTTAEGRTVESELDGMSPAWCASGEQVTLAYDPADPRRARLVAGGPQLTRGGLRSCPVVLGCGFLVIGGVMLALMVLVVAIDGSSR